MVCNLNIHFGFPFLDFARYFIFYCNCLTTPLLNNSLTSRRGRSNFLPCNLLFPPLLSSVCRGQWWVVGRARMQRRHLGKSWRLGRQFCCQRILKEENIKFFLQCGILNVLFSLALGPVIRSCELIVTHPFIYVYLQSLFLSKGLSILYTVQLSRDCVT